MNWDQFEKEQPIAARLLKNSLVNRRIAHAYLFEGEHGTGKKEASLLMAASLFCEENGQDVTPCDHCGNCKRIKSGNHPDVHIVEPDGLSIKIDQIRALRTEFSKSGMESKRKLYIIIDAEKMTVQAANSLLKFLEEPHAETTAVLVTDQPQQLLPTIISRCQSVPFHPLTPEFFAKRLEEAGVPKGKTFLLAAITNDLQEALRLNDDDWFAQARKIVLKLYEVLNNPLYAMTTLQVDWIGHFKEKAQHDMGLSLLLYIYKDVLNIQLGKDRQLVYPDQRQTLEKDALQTSMKRLSEQMTAILEAKRKLHANMNPQLLMEQLVLNLQGGPSFV
ncbi:DNA polymerase III subunit delta' [Siminovitchia acidinfaciens]|uniref:DNA polymerase III subunit delta' n=1 Tax=Siminovitchia acidinfaciens TaxID=2321395 RepID=A0A429XTN3_9BACI|nr:DNA polymerase III subunit delta' [Siminovitchia acidinfaciens]RST71162.1 DNA polymerase III subunit delta' [Siminovitchia acidinfaciens]